ncbi:hypothetical protein ILYODFUR_031637 [Ilyodon furcidens]|uniref:Uncharacterized protein n=1 Tax=Ilyodon furcidens TaxID=33524 RepID=A0ABV0UAS0_9TELE
MLSPTPSDPTALSPGRSSCSSDTGDILIRSTRIVLPDGRQEAAEITQPVQITVQKLRDPQPVQPNRIKEKQRLQKARHKPEVVDPKRAAADSQIGQELQTSCYKGGGRGVVLGALRQRCHITHHKREVSVQLLEPRLPPNTSNHQNTPDLRADAAAGVSGGQTEVSTGCLGDISKTAAAAAAAAVAATAPLIKRGEDS